MGVVFVKIELRRFWLLALMISLAALPAFASQPTVRTFTDLTVVSSQSVAGSATDVRVKIVAANGDELTGAVTLMDGERVLAGAATKDGAAEFSVNLTGGAHELKAVYEGDEEHQASASEALKFHTENSTTPTYALSLNPASLTLTAGQAGDSAVTLTPSNNGATTGPTFFTLSCSGLPANSSCYFTPSTIQIPAGSNAPASSNLTLQTQAASGALHNPFNTSQGIALAILLPGIFALGFFGRKRSSFTRLMMLGVVVFTASVAFTGCGALYQYHNHGPPKNPATPSGTYTILITAQTNNGVVATSVNTTFALTVK
jgi:hypothetical protein